MSLTTLESNISAAEMYRRCSVFTHVQCIVCRREVEFTTTSQARGVCMAPDAHLFRAVTMTRLGAAAPALWSPAGPTQIANKNVRSQSSRPLQFTQQHGALDDRSLPDLRTKLGVGSLSSWRCSIH